MILDAMFDIGLVSTVCSVLAIAMILTAVSRWLAPLAATVAWSLAASLGWLLFLVIKWASNG